MQIKNRLQRRTFLGHAIVGCVASTLTITSSVRGNDEKTCEKEPFADLLLLFIELLFDVQAKAFHRAAEDTFPLARDCEKTLCDLSKKIDELKTEICQSPTSKRAQQMRDLVEVGRANAQLLQKTSGTSDAKFASLAVSLNTINSVVDDAAKDVETECKFILTDRGKRLLQEIMNLIDRNRWICTKITTSQKDYAKQVDRSQCLLGDIRHFIFDAAEAASHKDAAGNISPDNLAKFNASIDEAVRALLELDPTVKDQEVNTDAPIERLSDSKTPEETIPADRSKTDSANTRKDTSQCMNEKVLPLPPGNPAEILIGLLRGTQALFKNFDARPKVSRNGKKVLFITVAAHSRNQPAESKDIGELLEKYCKPYTYYRRAKLTLGVDVAWTIYRSEPQKRLAAIAWTIAKMGCGDNSNPTALANILAT